ncbi:hypothetical protein VNI00_018177 [Paramarasmius palmivorus]|uniref:Uncharacterized protein n=1 Tax=Paramarasmius palmivorus TaxID=297713 RepID=A0AAW0B1V3_9AGAR
MDTSTLTAAAQETKSSVSSTRGSSAIPDDTTAVEAMTAQLTSTTSVAEETPMSRSSYYTSGSYTSGSYTSTTADVVLEKPSTYAHNSASLSMVPAAGTPTSTGPSSNESPNLFGAILGTILGILTVPAAVLLYVWYRRRLASRMSSRIVFSKDTMAPIPWSTSSHFNSGKKSQFMLDPQLGDDVLDTSTIAPSDSVSQMWTKEKVFEKRRPLRESSDLTIITEK